MDTFMIAWNFAMQFATSANLRLKSKDSEQIAVVDGAASSKSCPKAEQEIESPVNVRVRPIPPSDVRPPAVASSSANFNSEMALNINQQPLVPGDVGSDKPPDAAHQGTAQPIPIVESSALPDSQAQIVTSKGLVMHFDKAGGERGSIESLPPLPSASSWFTRLVESSIFRSHIDQLILETNPPARLEYCQRLRKLYNNPLMRLSSANRRRIEALDSQIEEIDYLMTEDNGKLQREYRSESDFSTSVETNDGRSSESHTFESKTTHYMPEIAVQADEQASALPDDRLPTHYSKPLKRFLQESSHLTSDQPSLDSKRRSESSHIRSGSIHQQLHGSRPHSNGYQRESDDALNPKQPQKYHRHSDGSQRRSTVTLTRKQPGFDLMSRVSEEGAPSVPLTTLQRKPKDQYLVVPSRPSRASDQHPAPRTRPSRTSASRTSSKRKSEERPASATHRVSHKTASQYTEQIDIRAEMRDPRIGTAFYGSSM